MGRRVVLAMSGGVDSSVAAHLLKSQGYDVIGLFMRTGAHADDAERRAKTCCSATDAIDAQRVADRLDIPFYALDFEREFGRIKDYFADEYLAGRTPNPCVMCNIWLKFGKLWAYGKQVGADYVATGHYARIARAGDGTLRVARAHDRAKDQSYVLFGLRPDLLPHVLFPAGEYPKPEIRRIAREHDLPVTTSRIAKKFASFRMTITCDSCVSVVPSVRPREFLSTRKAKCCARIQALRVSLSASAGVWESRWARRAMSSRSSR